MFGPLGCFLLRGFMLVNDYFAGARIDQYFLNPWLSGNLNIEGVDQTAVLDLEVSVDHLL